jgi:hypothetical protein
MSKKVRIELTQLEAESLYSVADNGWGDGDFAEWLDNRHHSDACLRAMEKLRDATFPKPQQHSKG